MEGNTGRRSVMRKYTIKLRCILVGILTAVLIWGVSDGTTYVSASDIPDGTTDYAASALSSVNYKIYSSLKKQILEVAEGKRTSTSFNVSVSGLGLSWTYSQLGLANGAGDSAVKSAVDSAFKKVVDIDAILGCLKCDCPYQMYWYDLCTGTACSYDYSYNGSTVTVTALKYYMPVSGNYSAGEYRVDSAKVAQAQAAALNAWTIVQEYADLPDEEKLQAYADRICEMVSYDYDAYYAFLENSSYPGENSDPWAVISVFDNDPDTNVVCEGYAKALLYLCNMSTFESENTACYYGSGEVSFGDDGHAWNVVSLDSGHYLIDLTRYDTDLSGEALEDSLALMVASGLSAEEIENAKNYVIYYMISPVSGTLEEGYTFSIGPLQEDTYTYDEYIRDVYSEDILSLYSVVTPTVTGTTSKTFDGTTDVIRTADLAVSLDGVLSAHENQVMISADYQYVSADVGENIEILISNITISGAAADYYRLSADSLTVSGKIIAKELTEEMVSMDESVCYYTGEEIMPSVTVSDLADGVELITEADYTMEYSDNREVGTALITFTGQGNYIGTVELPFEITYMEAPEYSVNGTEGENGWYTSEISLYADGWMISEDGNEWKESVPVTEEGISELLLYFRQNETGYMTDAIAVEMKLDWTPMEIDGDITAWVLDSEGFLKLRVSEAGTLIYLISTENPGELTEAEAKKSEESQTVEETGGGGGQWTAADLLENVESRTFTVTEEELSGVTLAFEDLSPETTCYVWVLGIDLAGNVCGNAVFYEFIVPTLSETPQLSGIYGTTAENMTLTGGRVTYENTQLSGIWSASDEAETGASSSKKEDRWIPAVGGTDSWVVTFTPDQEENITYAAVSVEVIPAVEKKKITVTADSVERKRGEENPVFTFTVEEGGLVDGDTADDLGVVLTTQALESSSAGKYEITGTAQSSNYQVTIISGTLTVSLTATMIALRAAAALLVTAVILAVVFYAAMKRKKED